MPVSCSGILVKWASWWNRHLACSAIYSSGQDAHSTKLVIPERARCPLYEIGYSRFPIPDSRFPIPDSRFPLLPKYLLNF
ncbi:hypothetical protein BJP36_41175 [Moorena producens JHB]|uniref:Uncharacterized protein n=1 Tax=Moorena producens (strain JHB) TaxID=1454205 RepID=A0A9Q9UVF4_MOOP1|nr:hypothetical protein [Moorena producens]WAN68780.1 hypothetical protein BJP36_41175 [Moorena producens JHB]